MNGSYAQAQINPIQGTHTPPGDNHIMLLSVVTGNGVASLNQLNIFSDQRTGATNVVVPNSGFIVNWTTTLNQDGSVTLVTTKTPSAATAGQFGQYSATAANGTAVQSSVTVTNGTVTAHNP